MKQEALKLADELDALHQYVPSEAPAMIRRLVEELDKQGEPVVYWDGKHFTSKEKSSLADIPLYTTPRELSNEEIIELTKDSSIFEYREFNDDMVRFAIAILRKAQEK